MRIRHCALIQLEVVKTAPLLTAEHVVDTVCPLDCPDACSLDVTLQDGRITSIDGSPRNRPPTATSAPRSAASPSACTESDRLIHPAIRKGPKGYGLFERASWDDAMALIATKLEEARESWGGESILPYSYGGLERPADAGHRRRHAVSPTRCVAARSHGVRRADRGCQ